MTGGAILVGEVAKNSREMIRVSLDRFKDFDTTDMRVWTKGDAPAPTKAGITIRVALLPELVALLADAEAEARKRGLLI